MFKEKIIIVFLMMIMKKVTKAESIEGVDDGSYQVVYAMVIGYDDVIDDDVYENVEGVDEGRQR